MLIYNYQKEFLGIEEKDLKILGFETLAELKAEVSDFADLFVKTPGYVHNFKHVHWIDFIAYADEGEEAKVIINVNAKTFTAKLGLNKAYLADNPSVPAFMIHLNGLRSLSNDETQKLSAGVLERERPEVTHKEPSAIIPTADIITPSAAATVVQESPATLQVEQYEATIQPASEEILDINDTHDDLADLSIDIDESIFQDEDEIFTPESTEQEVIQTKPKVMPKVNVPKTTATVSQAAKNLADTGFVYDPSVASRELGLPLDLIEEFIQDFITQAREFQPKIYASLEEGDIDNVKILAHKLKGVAANLRVEDAHEVLSTISATSDAGVIRENMDAFYIIMTKLEGEESIEENSSNTIEDDEPLELSFKDEEPLQIADEEVPEQIEIAELADDDFYQQDLLQEDSDEEISLVELNDEEPFKQNSNETVSNTTGYSKKEVAAQIGLSLEDFNELFADFEQESQTIFQKMKQAAQDKDFETVQREALKLKGMSDNMRLETFTDQLSKIINEKDTQTIIKSIDLLQEQLIQISAMGA